MKQGFAPFGLAHRIRIRKIAVTAIASVVALFGIVAIVKFVKEQANAVTGNGANVTITAGSEIAYGDWQTHIYSVTNSAGDTFTGFCADPKKHTTTGTYKAVVSSDSLANNKIKLALYAYRGDKNGNNTAATNLMNSLFQNSGYTNDKYVYIHAIIGYIHSGDTTGLDSQQITFVQEASRKLGTEISDETDVWVMAKDWRLYEIDKQGNDIQNIMWIENNRQYANIAVVKCDTINTNCVPSGAANFGNVEFTLVYVGSSRVYDNNRKMFFSAGQVVATETTDASGTAVFSNLPLGDYVVSETSMNNPSLEFSGGEQPVQLTDGNTTKSLTFKNQIVRGDVKFMKVDEEGRSMAHIPFRITSETTGESHIVVSNYAGIVNTATSHIPHSENTNGYDSIADVSNISFQGYGTWFGREGTTGATAPVNNDVGALPYDTYTIQELSCVNNQDCQNIGSQVKRFTIDGNGAVVDLGNWVNNCSDYSLETVAIDATDGDKAISPISGVRIKDTVSYKVKKEVPYTIVSNLMDKTTMQPVMHNGQAVSTYVVIPQSNNEQGTVEMFFDFDATELVGRTLVVFSYLFEDGVAAPLVSHEDWDNLNQSVVVPSISTEATNAEGATKQIEAAPNQTIADRVNYCLLPGRQYKFIATLVDTNHENILINGASVTAEKTINIDANNPSCNHEDITLTFDASSLAGRSVMVSQTIIDTATNTQVGATHYDPGDGSQIVTISDEEPPHVDPPYQVSIGTTAVDNADGDKFIKADSNAKIKDTIEYCIEGNTSYTISGVLMDKSTREPVMYNGNRVTTSTNVSRSTDGCDTTDVVFTFDATDYAGKDLTVFEYLYKGSEVVASHASYNYTAQTVTVLADETPISLGTIATDAADGDKYIVSSTNQKIKDTVSYCLKTTSSYQIKGILKDKATGEDIKINGETIEQTATITPTTNCGRLDLTFDLDASELAGKAVVVYEYAYSFDSGASTEPVVSHEDINDEAQTVYVVSLGTTATDANDNDKTISPKAGQKIKDTVDYCLKADTSYIIKGILKDKATGEDLKIDGKTIEQSIELTPEQNCGQTELIYDIDASTLAGKEIVVFEYAYEKGVTIPEDPEIPLYLVVSHENINDEAQSINVSVPTPDTGIFSAGSDQGSSSNIILIVTGITVAVGCYVGYRFLHRHHIKFN